MASYIQGKYTKCIFKNNTGYNIGVFRVSDSNDPSLADYIGRSITFTGYFHDLNEIDTYLFYGKLVTHEKYGEQFQVESYERCMPEEKDSIVEFLTSGLFKGIGEAKAKKLIAERLSSGKLALTEDQLEQYERCLKIVDATQHPRFDENLQVAKSFLKGLIN